jgi:hypothetical protein
MTLALFQVISQSISSTLHWVGLYIGIRALPGDASRQRAWVVISALVFAAWLVGIVLLASDNFFPPSRIPVALFATLALGYLILLSRTFRAIVAGIPQHWLIGIPDVPDPRRRVSGSVFRGSAARALCHSRRRWRYSDRRPGATRRILVVRR